MEVLFEETGVKPEKIKYSLGGYRKGSGQPRSKNPRHKVFFMLSPEIVKQLHGLPKRKMSKFVIEVISCYDWSEVTPQGLKPIDKAVPFHVRLPESMAVMLNEFPLHDKSRHLNDCLEEQLKLIDEEENKCLEEVENA